LTSLAQPLASFAKALLKCLALPKPFPSLATLATAVPIFAQVLSTLAQELPTLSQSIGHIGPSIVQAFLGLA
jgi:hypothetical protein